MKSSDSGRTALQRALEPTAECIPIERIGEAWTAAETAHADRCPRCQTELALWRAVETAAASAEEREAVEWITDRVRSRRAPPTQPSRHARQWAPLLPRMAVLAASVALVAVVGYGLWNPEPAVRVTDGDTSPVYRSAQVQPLAPIGDVAAPPRTLEWAPFAGAERYDVRLLEVDRSVVWQTTTAATRVQVPADVVARFVPGKTLLWEVAVRNAAGETVAESGSLRFRVTPPGKVERRR